MTDVQTPDPGPEHDYLDVSPLDPRSVQPPVIVIHGAPRREAEAPEPEAEL